MSLFKKVKDETKKGVEATKKAGKSVADKTKKAVDKADQTEKEL